MTSIKCSEAVAGVHFQCLIYLRHQDMRQAEGIAGRHGKTSTKAARRAATAKKAKRPKYPVVTEYDLIPEGKLIATVYKPPPPSAKTTAAANAGSGAVENVTGNANIQSSVSASAPAKEGSSTEAVLPENKPTHVKADVAPAAAASAVVAGAKSDGSSTTAKPTTTKAISTDKVSASSTASQSIDASSKGHRCRSFFACDKPPSTRISRSTCRSHGRNI